MQICPDSQVPREKQTQTLSLWFLPIFKCKASFIPFTQITMLYKLVKRENHTIRAFSP